MRYDLPEVARRADIVALVGRYVALRKQGRDFVGLCPFHAERSPSFNVIPSKGKYHCFGCGAHGDAIDFVRKHLGYDLGRAAQFLGGCPEGPDSPPPPAKSPPPAKADDAAGRVALARRIWKESCDTPMTSAEHYLRGRGINVDLLPEGRLPPTLRYHRKLRHTGTGRDYGALVGYMKDHGGFTGVHRTYLAPAPAAEHPAVRAALDAQGVGRLRGEVVVKAPVDGAKRMLGVAKGAAVRLAPAGEVLAVAEGIETALSVMVSTGLPTWAALSLGNMGGLVLPPEVQKVVLCADNDMKDPAAAEEQLQKAAHAYRDQGAAVEIARPPAGMDFNDLLLAKYRGRESSTGERIR